MMYKDLKKVYVRKLDDIINPTDNMLYITEDTGKAYIWDGIKAKLQELSGSDDSEFKETDPIWNAEKDNYYKKDETYSKKGVDDRLALKADADNVYSKEETYSRAGIDTGFSKKADKSSVYTMEEVDASQAAQDVRIKALEDGGGTPIDTYTKAEIDEQQAKQDENINNNTNILVDFTKRINVLEEKEESDPVWNSEKEEYRKVTDQDFIDNELNEDIKKVESDVNALKTRESFPAIATGVTKLIDNVTSNTNNLTFETNPKFYRNNNIFNNNNGVITNTVTADVTNNIIIEGDIQLIMAGIISAVTTVTISCADDINGVKKQRQFTISTESSFAIPFKFVIPGDKSSTTITVTFSGLSGLSSRKIMPSYVTFRKLK